MVLDAVTFALTTSDDVQLEAILSNADNPTGTVVLCHPHPLQGGTMRAPILGAITKECLAAGMNVLRFNFRGVGESGGIHGDGEGELLDVDAAVTWAHEEAAPVLGIAGWSFGAAVALRWQASTASNLAYCGIAPPVDRPLSFAMPKPEDLEAARRTFIVGNRDQLIDVEALVTYGESIDAKIVRYETADHFFVFRHERLAQDVVAALAA